MQGHVQIKTSSNHCQLIVGKTYGKVWLSSFLIHSRSLEAQNKQHHLCINRQRFCVKYTPKSNAKHFLNVLRQKYSIPVDRGAKTFIDIGLKWDYIQRTATLSMLEYVRQALHKFHHTLLTTPEYNPHAHVAPTYG